MIALLSRIFGKLKSRTYDGGGSGRRWRGAADMPNQRSAMLAARGPIGRRARYLVGNNALAASGAATWVDSIIGTGIRPMSAHPNRETRRRINAAFERWTDGADADDLGDFYALQALAVRRAVVDGECFAVMVPDRAGLRLRLMDAEQVDPTLSREMTGGARIVQGIEFDAAGRRVAYHALRDRPGLPLATSLDTVRLPAADVAHLFRPDVPGQVRGLSWFAPILLRLYDIDAAHDAQLMRQKVGALLAGFIRPSADGLFDAERKSGSIFEASLEPGELKVLDAGAEIQFSTPPQIGPEAIAFMTMMAREIAAGLGVPYEALTGDLTSVNYSSIRAGLVAFRRRVEALQHNVVVFQFCRPIWRRWLTLEVLFGRLDLPGFEREPEACLAVRWMPPRSEWIDPLKDAKAELLAIEGRLMSRREAVAARGRDLEELDAEIKADGFGAPADAKEPA